MIIDVKKEKEKLIFRLKGRLDTTTAPELEAVFKEQREEASELELDFGGLEYLSSAGLRVLLAAFKEMKKQEGRMVIKNVNEEVMEVFTITGFAEILTIE